jgi:hypothetical protein
VPVSVRPTPLERETTKRPRANGDAMPNTSDSTARLRRRRRMRFPVRPIQSTGPFLCQATVLWILRNANCGAGKHLHRSWTAAQSASCAPRKTSPIVWWQDRRGAVCRHQEAEKHQTSLLKTLTFASSGRQAGAWLFTAECSRKSSPQSPLAEKTNEFQWLSTCPLTLRSHH